MYQKKLDQNKITINFCFIIDIDILFMNSFLILMFFKEGVAKKNVVLIISLVKIFTNGKNTEKQVARMSLSFNVEMDKLKKTIL